MKSISKVERKHGGVEVIDVPVPSINADEVLVKIKYASICGSDVHAFHFAPTHHFIQPPVIMGHECSGEVAEIGEHVTGFTPGDRVVIEAVDYCGKCESCLRGKVHICNHFQIRGMHRDGVFAEYVAVKEQHLHRIPDSLALKDACLVEPTAVLCHGILERSDIKAGDLVMVTGPGPIGLLAAQVIRNIGAEPFIVGIDSDEDIRLPIARDLGFKTINVSHQTVQETLNSIYRRDTVHAVVECSGAPSVFQTSIEVVVKGGSITLIGLFPKRVEANLSIAVRKEINIYTSFASTWVDFERAIKLLDEGVIQTSNLVSYYQPEEAIQAFEDAIAKKVPKPVFQF
jgi:L-iditol 2-dehydrogenase